MANEKILIIEDNEELVEIMVNFLKSDNYVTRSATNGEAGIQAAKAFSPQLIILDIMLPKVDGI